MRTDLKQDFRDNLKLSQRKPRRFISFSSLTKSFFPEIRSLVIPHVVLFFIRSFHTSIYNPVFLFNLNRKLVS